MLKHVVYNYEYEKKIKACFIGAGGHSYRNVYPTFQYAPIDLLAVCDVDEERAAACAKQFGAAQSYTDHHVMLQQERPDAVFIVTNYDADGRVRATSLAMDCLQAGAHVWMEKPVAASISEVEQLMSLSEAKDLFVMVGLKKIFFPSIVKVKEIISSPEFGKPSSLYIRYPQHMPPFEERDQLLKVNSLLDHIFHPGAIIHYLMGKVERMSYEWEQVNGGSVTNLRFTSGAIGTLQFVAGMGGSSPLERLEVIGQGASVVVENGVKVYYYRNTQGRGPEYGRSASSIVDNDIAPLFWEPEFSLGQLYNKNIFMLGYVQEVLHFCESILQHRQPEKGTLAECIEILKLFEAYRTTPEGVVAVI